MERRIWLLVIALSVSGCGEQGVFPDSGDPRIQVKTPEFSTLDGRAQTEGVIRITNVGNGPLGVDELDIREEGPDATAEVLAFGPAWNQFHVLKAGQSVKLTVRYDPENIGKDSAWVVMEHNDVQREQYAWKIPLPTVRPDIEVIGTGPNGNLKFPEVKPGDSQTKAVLIRNKGNFPLTVDKVELGTNPRFSYKIVEGPEGTPDGL